MTNYGITEDYEYTATHKRAAIDVWSGPFFHTWEARGLSLPGGAGYMLTTYNGDKVRVETGALRGGQNYRAVDSAISLALNNHHCHAGRKQATG